MGLRENLDQDERIGEPHWELSSIFGTDSLKFGSALTTCIHTCSCSPSDFNLFSLFNSTPSLNLTLTV